MDAKIVIGAKKITRPLETWQQQFFFEENDRTRKISMRVYNASRAFFKRFHL